MRLARWLLRECSEGQCYVCGAPMTGLGFYQGEQAENCCFGCTDVEVASVVPFPRCMPG